MILVDPIIAEGAGLAARRKGHTLIGAPRAETGGQSPVTAAEYRTLKRIGFADTSQWAALGEHLTLAFFSHVENEIAAAGDVINGTGELFLDPHGALKLHVRSADGSPALDLSVGGVPVVAMRAPAQRTTTDWDQRDALPLDELLPEPVRGVVRHARWRQLKTAAKPLFHEERIYCGYSLMIDVATRSSPVTHRIDVTAAAGFLFPFELAAPGVDAEDLRKLIAVRLDADEPADVVTDFESRYLASASIASYYRQQRQQEILWAQHD